jgi:cbb3-type cytochrome oxidase maturation protein
MSVIYILLAISIAIAFFIVFILAVKSGQYDDSYTCARQYVRTRNSNREKPI